MPGLTSIQLKMVQYNESKDIPNLQLIVIPPSLINAPSNTPWRDKILQTTRQTKKLMVMQHIKILRRLIHMS